MEIVKKKLSEIKPLEKNVRRHGDNQLEHFAEALRQFGQTRAFVIDEAGTILVGNGMFEAMTRMGWKKQVDCHIVRGLSEIEKKKLILSDNKLFQLGSDDYDAMQDMLQEIADAGDFNVAGFSADVLESLVKGAEDMLADAATYGILAEEERQEKERREIAAQEEEFVGPPPAVEMVHTCPHCGGEMVFRGGDLVAAED